MLLASFASVLALPAQKCIVTVTAVATATQTTVPTTVATSSDVKTTTAATSVPTTTATVATTSATVSTSATTSAVETTTPATTSAVATSTTATTSAVKTTTTAATSTATTTSAVKTTTVATTTATTTKTSATTVPTQPAAPHLPEKMPAVNGNLTPTIYTSCKNPKHWALTFDDGPSSNVPALVDALTGLDVKATFFVNGLNYADLSTKATQDALKKAYDAGHQIASHTFKHEDAAALSQADLYNTLLLNDKAIYNVIGKSPRHFRYPFLSRNAKTDAALASWGFDIVMINVDTKDYEHNSETTTEQQQIDANRARYLQDFKQLPAGSSVISLDHDFTKYIVSWTKAFVGDIKAKGYTLVTTAECIGTDAYRK